MDQPSIDGINTWFVSKAARELGLKAAISGLGGDELFGGYPSFVDIPRWVRWGALPRSEEHTSELQSHLNLVCRLLLEKKKIDNIIYLMSFIINNWSYVVD